mmetsp:Transcript_21705/g.45857  ORF Transcript_21705/g.45857 Transcript_21705/m.45857 type:complete len:724 (-) Transcript_21705:324-2495(-)|eukprot:CAMPEP_0183735154 /NCGR_PEP_ID=MMETSP0737-20130205/45863_1 /TAXON_ID=385413 /ORGANISM="Thalassiosira miniscula, Strain CCMP1093" /LENGTH=723 /DNA_ID=CAMNT_0025968817 /DNA_START=87 /DNA_END=2258 /DNA_ORIENTATION=-
MISSSFIVTTLLQLLLVLVVVVTAQEQEEAATATAMMEDFTCDMPSNGCTNGMYNVHKCACECIPPYCPWTDGTCTLPSGNCGGNPWKDCERGVSCPWWINPLKDESCVTGPEVPPDTWEIYNTKKACCSINFIYSSICDPPLPEPPTTHPTIAVPDNDFEIIPIKFDFMGLPDDISMRELKDEMKIVLKRILLRLAKRIEGLRISNVEETLPPRRRRNKQRQRELLRQGAGRADDSHENDARIGATNFNSKKRKNRRTTTAITTNTNKNNEGTQQYRHDASSSNSRVLARDVSIYFNVYVFRVEGKKFSQLIILEMRQSYEEVIDQIRTFTDTQYFTGGDINLNFCTANQGQFTVCAKDAPPPPSPTFPPKPRPPPAVVYSAPKPEQEPEPTGLPIWAIVLIVIVCLIILCCVGYLIYAFCTSANNDDKESPEIRNNIYGTTSRGNYWGKEMGDDYTRKSRKSSRRMLTGGSDRGSHRGSHHDSHRHSSRKSRRRSSVEGGDGDQEVQIILAEEQQEPKLYLDQEEFTIKEGARTLPDGHTIYTNGTQSKYRGGRDPSVYNPDNEGKPDPDSDNGMLLLTDGGNRRSGGRSSRRYSNEEDPPTKPKRDPTMYGGYSNNNDNVYDPPTKLQADPSMYFEGQRDPSFCTATNDEDDDFYDSGGYISYARDGSGTQSGRDPTYYDFGVESQAGGISYRTEEPSGSVAAASSKRSKKSKKKKSSNR